MKNIYIIISALLFSFIFYPDGYPGNEQTIKDFYLSNFKNDGSSDWEIEGKEAVINGDIIDIQTMDANYYLDKETISVSSDQAKLNKKNQNIWLNGNVKIKNEQGWNLKTDQLNWQRTENYIKTDSIVETEKDSLFVKAKGLHADSQLKTADFKKDVKVTYKDKNQKDATTITCSGPLEIDYNKGRATFKEDVVVNHKQGKLFSDLAILFFDTKEKKIIKIISKGHVKIVRDSNVTFAEKAIYLAAEEKLTLEGSPRLIYFPEENDNGSSGFFGID
ncbi:MAG: LPS export ABC transporter periplasmic protein LptC [Candidatus Omnitrophica bacterium]|nr:LPS export ABC transporter periplasmic protein LptC [Candidatus Omnitrophota bacterium]MCF7893007.1 LPS export ABC transporter periplasmic protein LptC [Candidatus Omnitrophota bacterium]